MKRRTFFGGLIAPFLGLVVKTSDVASKVSTRGPVVPQKLMTIWDEAWMESRARLRLRCPGLVGKRPMKPFSVRKQPWTNKEVWNPFDADWIREALSRFDVMGNCGKPR